MKTVFLASALLLAVSLHLGAADKLAVAEPVGKGGVNASEIEMFWGILESSIRSPEYQLISRAALKQMMTEIGLTGSSGLVNLNAAQKAELGRLETVRYLLVSEIGRFGTRLNCTLRILDSSTGEIDQTRTKNIRCRDLDELADKVEPVLQEMLSRKKIGYGGETVRVAMLAPLVTYRPSAARTFVNAAGFTCRTTDLNPADLVNEFASRMKNAFTSRNIRLQYFTSLNSFLKKNSLDAIGEMDGYAYQKLGRELGVKYLLVMTIPRFTLTQGEKTIAETGVKARIFETDIECLLELRNVEEKGDVVCQETFTMKQDLRKSVAPALLKTWTIQDCSCFAIQSLVEKQIRPWLAAAKEFKEK